MTLRVVKLVAENVKGLKAIEIEPDEHFQVISGKNGQGKTSVLDAIWYAIGGSDALKGTRKPIRDGADSASVSLDLGDIAVTRKWKNGKTTLDVRTKDGAKYSSPQSMLDSLVGRLSFDPFAFSNLKDAEQKQELLQLVDIPIDLDELAEQRKSTFDDRTIVNREIKRLEGQMSGMELPADEVPGEELSATEILAKIQDQNEVLNSNNKKREELEDALEAYDELQEEVQGIEEKIRTLQNSLESAKGRLATSLEEGKKLRAEVDALVDPDFDELKSQLENIEIINQEVRTVKEYHKVEGELDAKKAEIERLTAAIQKIDQDKEDALKKANFPIEGLGFDESGVTLNGIPFRDCSAAERLKVSMSMAMALNPKLRVIRILDGSLLDSANLQLIQDMATEKDYQVWVEVVDESGKVGLFIEDGAVKEMVPDATLS